MSEIQIKAAEYLVAQGIKFTVTGGTPTKRDDWECDAWQFKFSRAGRPDLLGQFYTGIGLRKLSKIGERMVKQAGKCSAFYLANLKNQYSSPVAPCAASVLYSILIDASGAEQNFHDWCSEFGSDPDSIKALNTYNACCEMLQKVRNFFTREERAAIQVLLEDY